MTQYLTEIRVVLFAHAREAWGEASFVFRSRRSRVAIADVIAFMCRERPEHTALLTHKAVRFVVGGQVVTQKTPLRGGEELGILPPVSGG